MTVAFHRQELANETDKGLKILGSFLEQTDVQQTENGAAESAAGNANSIAVANGANGNTWHFECGPASEVLEFTRGQIFDELLRLRDDERQRIGQELHDSAGQLLLSLQLTAGRLRDTHINCEHERLLVEIQDPARLISEEIRSIAFLNLPAQLHPSGRAT